ncbi:MAG: heavy-metal-associated domain-containing protein, partial [Parasphingorhabdus sp.]
MSFLSDFRIKIAAIIAAVTVLAGTVVYAQLEGTERGVAPLASTGDFEVMGVEVNVSGDDAFDARKKGWEQAQRKAWKILYKRTQGGNTSGLSDGTLNTVVSAIIVEQEQIGPKRYIATLGVMFDRARAGSILGVGGRKLRSPPLLVLPIMWSGGSPQVFESRTEWQKA